MTWYVGDTYSYTFETGVEGEVFTRYASYIATVSTIWNPTFIDIGDGWYRAEYDIEDVGAHEWAGTGSATGALSVNFTVDPEPAVATTTVLTAVPSLGQIAGQQIGRYDLVIPQARDVFIPIAIFTGDTRLNTFGFLARLTIRKTYGASTELLLSTGDGTLQTGYDPPRWETLTSYSVGQRVVPRTGLNGRIYEVITAGTSGSSNPTWPTTLGDTVSSGSAVFRAEDVDTYVSNVRIVLAPSDTEALTDWGIGVYDLVLEDEFGKQKTYLAGNAMMQRFVSASI